MFEECCLFHVSESSNMVAKCLRKSTERRRAILTLVFKSFIFVVIWLLSFQLCGTGKHHGRWSMHWDKSFSSAGKGGTEGGGERGEAEARRDQES